jgi:hypothetical protein
MFQISGLRIKNHGDWLFEEPVPVILNSQAWNLEHDILETAWNVWIFRPFIFVSRWYEWFWGHRVPEMDSSVWKINVIALVFQKSAPNLRHNYARGAEVCPKTGASLCPGGNDMAKSGDIIAWCALWVPEIWGTILPGVHKRPPNLGDHYAWGAMTVSKLRQIIARCA